MEVEDPVVAEISVILARPAGFQSYLVQYPGREAFPTPDPPQGVRFKPVNQCLEMDIPLDMHTPNYDADKGCEYGLSEAADSGQDSVARDTKVDGSKLEPKQPSLLFTSSTLPKNTKYMAGILRHQELFLSPLHGLVQMRPSLRHLDDLDSKRKDYKKAAMELEEDTPGDLKLRPVQLKIKSMAPGEDFSSIASQLPLYDWQKRFDEEAWIPMDFCSEESAESYRAYEQLLAFETSSPPCKDTPQTYLQQISALSAP